jgi:peptidoglycan L-alanyl-D-glutamate endopeptidase CwlK
MNLVDTIKAIQRAVGAEADGVFGPVTAGRVWKMLNAELPTSNVEETGESGDSRSVIDARTLENIATLDPKCQDRFRQFALLAKATAATFGCDYVMICGHRTWEEQDALFEQRPIVTRAPGGYSNHNFGIAGDFGVFRGKVYLDESNKALADQVHEACAVHARKLGFEWGGDWKKLKDYPHFEISTGLTMGAKRLLYKKGGSVL